MQKQLFALSLFFLLLRSVFSQSSALIPVPPEMLEEIRMEAESIREESLKLRTLLMLSETESLGLKSRLMTAEQELITVSGNLEKSGADLTQLRSDLAKLRQELTALKQAAEESNSLLKKSRREAVTWKVIAAGSIALGLTGLIIGVLK